MSKILIVEDEKSKSGAQDYITKPFEPLELLARIEAYIRLELIFIVIISILYLPILLHLKKIGNREQIKKYILRRII